MLQKQNSSYTGKTKEATNNLHEMRREKPSRKSRGLGTLSAFLLLAIGCSHPTTAFLPSARFRSAGLSPKHAVLLPSKQNDDVDAITFEEDEAKALLPKNKQSALRTALREYRTFQANSKRQPPYWVFTNASLEGILEFLPQTKQELLDVKGIGPKKVEKFGDDIVELVARYGGSHGVRESASKRQKLLPEVSKIDPATGMTLSKNKQSALRTALLEYRAIQANSKLQRPQSVFTNASLEGILELLPQSKQELLGVNGIGPKKVEKFGDDILELVARYGGSHGVRESASKRRKLLPEVSKIDPATLSKEQRRAADLALGSDSRLFITGAAGTGKSHVLKYILQELQAHEISFGVCAPTGVAAIHVGGTTLHSFFGIGLGEGSISKLVTKVKVNNKAQKRIDETEVLWIDECSMLSAKLLETLDAVVREVRQGGKFRDQPFGGMRICAVGDFFQLPPVYRGDSDWRPFCFESPVWSQLGLADHKVELKEVLRQGNRKFVQFLNMVRIGNMNERILGDLNAKCLLGEARKLPTDGIVPTRLYVLNADVDAENESRLAKLKGKEMICMANDEWRQSVPIGTPASTKKKMIESIEKEMPDEVRLKVGAQVMLTRNKSLGRQLVNGSRGIVERFVTDAEGGPIPIVRFDCGIVEKVGKVEAARYNPDGGEGCLVRSQVPLKLAWAMTVHKSQGSTLSRALLNLSLCFEYGQMYVALSRVKSLDGLWLEQPARLSNLMVSPQVVEFYNQ